MPPFADVGFAPMRLGMVVAVDAEDGPSFFAVLDSETNDYRLPILIGRTEGFFLSAVLSRVQFGRPMSPQFAAGLLHALGGRIKEVRIDRLVDVGGGSAYGSTVELEGPAGVALVDARPSDALSLVAQEPAPILVAHEVLSHARAKLTGDSPDAALLRRAIQAEQTSFRRL